MENKREKEERFFSIELKSKIQLRNFSLNNGSLEESILIEGALGKLIRAVFVDGLILEVAGTDGVLRINLVKEEIENVDKEKQQQKCG